MSASHSKEALWESISQGQLSTQPSNEHAAPESAAIVDIPKEGEKSSAPTVDSAETSVDVDRVVVANPSVHSSVEQQNILATAPDLKRLRSALLHTPPKGSVNEIAYHFIMPMVKAAREFPEVKTDIKVLACVWACGSLHPDQHSGLMAISRQGKTGAALFEAIWNQLYNDTSYTGKTRSLGSIYFLAKQAGWTYSNGGAQF